jgi:2-dehydro-3-deoxyphosphogluconate aldolase/(4S)-4-hydroxy-2-oxoglutarate aldolase
MTRHDIVNALVDGGAIAVIRMADAEQLLRVVEAVHAGGVSAIEITMTTPDALSVIRDVSRAFTEHPDVLVGVGSVLDSVTARLAIEAGARFVVSPILDEATIRMSHRYDVPMMPGCYTPTEIYRAHTLGADIVKIFPAQNVGMDYFRAVTAPMPHLKLMPTGGVTLKNAGDWLAAGACAVGVGSALLDKDAIAQGDYDVLTENARILTASVRDGRP